MQFLGPDGHLRLRSARVAVVGVGGLGSHVVQQLGFLGVTNLALIDGDRIDETNLNRLVTAGPGDIDAYKVDVLQRFVTTLHPGAEVRVVRQDLRSVEAFKEIKAADYLVGCIDNDGPRFLLNQLSAAYRKPYLDLGSDLGVDRTSYGGRLVFVRPGEGCLWCRNLLNRQEVREWLETEEERYTRARSYGQEITPDAGGGPSVVSLNGVVASLGVMELMLEISGVRPAHAIRIYNGVYGTVSSPADPKPDRNNCRICSEVVGQGDEAGLERFVVSPNYGGNVSTSYRKEV
jgi:hypothetical protein